MKTSKDLKFAIIGCGFWAKYQLPAWLELDGVSLVALYNRSLEKASTLAKQYSIPHCYDDAEEMFKNEKLDFVDIITDVDTHEHFTLLAAKYKVPVICQKPMAPSLPSARKMLNACDEAGIPFFVHEGFRWQAPIRYLQQALQSVIIGEPFKANVSFCSAFPVFDNQPFLAELDKFIITDIGSHILDICRFLFGEAESLYCLIATVNKKVKGEDVATVLMKMKTGLHCYAQMSYASILEKEVFPQTIITVEGSMGTIQLTNDFLVKITTKRGTSSLNIEPKMYDWIDPAYAVVHSSIVDCNRNILQSLQGNGPAETTGSDNFETVRLVWAAYESAKENKVMLMDDFQPQFK